MDFRGRSDRTGPEGSMVGAAPRDLISDIQRQQRRRTLRRAFQLTMLGLTLLLLGLAVKIAADRRTQRHNRELARERFLEGTVVEMREAADLLAGTLESDPGDGATASALALVRAQLVVEFGDEPGPAREALAAADGHRAETEWARGLLALVDDDVAAVAKAAERAPSEQSFSPDHGAYLRGLLALGRGEPAPRPVIDALASGPDAPAPTSFRRLRVALLLRSGDGPTALAELERMRAQHRGHMGLGADEVLYNAYLRQELAGVADVAEQLLEADSTMVSPRDRAHAALARGVVHVHLGERDRGIERLEQAWPALPAWDPLARELALQSALEAGATEIAARWVEEAGLPEVEAEIHEAWGLLARGDVMASLEILAKLPQEHPRVGYLQALALVEQLRFSEADPWIKRTEKLMPGRIEIEVAKARVELRLGDKAAALARLQVLAEEEPYAPRAFTGLGEAFLEQDGDVDLRKAQKALERAVEREPVPAEALLRLAEVWQAKPDSDGEPEKRALELLERAAKENPKLPRYRRALALYLDDYGYSERARELLEALVEEQGVETVAMMRLLRIAFSGPADEDLRKRARGWIEKAEESGATPQQVLLAHALVDIASPDREVVKKTRDALGEALKLTPEDVDTRLLHVDACMRLQERDEAELSIRRGLQATADENDGRLYLAWAELESRAGKRRKAAAHARVAWTALLAERRPPSELLRAAELAADLWMRENQPQVAMAIGREVTARLRFHPRAWTIRATTQLAGNRTAEARESAEQALDLDDEDPRAHQLHGHALLRFGLKDRAREAYLRAIELAKGTPAEADLRSDLLRL